MSAWRFWHWDPSNDRDFIGLPITTVSANPSQQSQVTQELRIASNGKRALDYVLGAFISGSRSTRRDFRSRDRRRAPSCSTRPVRAVAIRRR
ncbi:hypothetical protein GCM10020258_45170 [Sphingomonas yabuuchiae]